MIKKEWMESMGRRRRRKVALISVCYFDFSWFERLTMTVILLNCATLGMFQPCEDTVCDSQRCKILKVRRGRDSSLRSTPSSNSLHFPSFLSDLRRRDLPLLYGRDVHQDAGHGHRRQGLLSVRDVEQAGLLHRHGRVGLYYIL